jgi:hypothetical protein
MKILAILLSVYIVMLSATTCRCEYAMTGPDYLMEQQDTGAASHDCAGDCSPFCLCNACTGFTSKTFFSYFQLKIQEYVPLENNLYLSQIYSSPLLEGIWQPPQSITN